MTVFNFDLGTIGKVGVNKKGKIVARTPFGNLPNPGNMPKHKQKSHAEKRKRHSEKVKKQEIEKKITELKKKITKNEKDRINILKKIDALERKKYHRPTGKEN